MVFLVGLPYAVCVLVESVSYMPLTLFSLNSVFPRPSLLIGSVLASQLQSTGFGGRRGLGCFLWAPSLGGNMQWYLLLIWAQGLGQAPLPTSGAVSGRIMTMGNISAKEGGSVTLQCHLSSTTANVTQVNWEKQDQLLAVHHTDLGWHIYPAFRERVAPGPNLGLTLQSLTRNDTGEYLCTYHTYPDGIYRGTFFLEVLQSSVAERSAAFQIPLLGAMASVLAVICVAVILGGLWTRKKCRRVHCGESGLRTMTYEQEEQSPCILSSTGRAIQVEMVPVGLYTEQRADDYAEPHDYFNVLSYRSLGSFSFLAETG
ncbi:T-cell immunoreceptor with Ig and ITIM domains isoform X2 [Canis lupus baileyi]|uniref:T-cell immunoreceptor with Ig and ITIM domains n=2 Tax=Canis lupus familiaris TaxID=9615 RepID=A0A8I3NVR5_CANLF|nr:T-cell immunoreceptor with Ig and ITIM domains isoform X2 [Canis lupus dingo]XP_038300919.1 T-cell immunoreceptor with Ig and ITIM domains isoform X2 [Canis lupus familiaris]XP_038318563.1 T-cell immunoreceptor with Ig and ITIM domains isoform X2 [Canis lupus familiaris]XP_038438796.1 T-cell immunoreceptor with Ig and ITIM domains isoform X2 [Canis lupus familiaris]